MHPLTWQAPRPLWRGATPFAASPQILRFASDDFMDQAIATLTHEPSRISERIAVKETWRTPAARTEVADPVLHVPLPAPIVEAKRKRLFRAPVAAKPVSDPKAPVGPLKLYQPAHQRYYLIAGSLACAIPGLPERAVAGGHERVHFVLRRLLPKEAATETDPNKVSPAVEFAYVKTGDEAQWQLIESGSDLAPGEDLLPLFPLAHHDENGTPRTLWAGLIPVGRREDYIGKPVSRTVVALADGQLAAIRPPVPAPRRNSTAARTAQLRMEFSEPWKAMVRAAIKAAGEFVVKIDNDETAAERTARIVEYNFQFQMQSWLLLVDLRRWFAHIPRLDAALTNNNPAALLPPERAVWDQLGTIGANALGAVGGKALATSMRDALQRIMPFESKLDAAKTFYTPTTAAAADWPDFSFPLVGLRFVNPTDLIPIADGPFKAVVPPAPQADAVGTTLNPEGAFGDQVKIIEVPSDTAGIIRDAEELDRFTALLARALPVNDEAGVQPIPHAMKLRDVMIKTAGDPGLFVIRMVHINADCGPLHPPTLSAPTEQFALASFFDPDAPVRPITITLPTDTTPAGLRKHGRGAAFVMSDILCGQVQRAKGLGFIDLVLQVLPWPFHKNINVGDGGSCRGGGVEIGMICSLSIPIITLCALILLIIIVTLLDFIFRWLPWFIACFPVPKLKGKST